MHASADGVEGEHIEERRIPNQLHIYWSKVRNNKLFPSEKHFDINKLESIWGYCVLIEVNSNRQGRDRYRYAWMGKDIWSIYEFSNSTDGLYHRLFRPTTAEVQGRIESIENHGGVFQQASSFVNSKGFRIQYRQCLLPLSQSGSSVDFIVGALTWTHSALDPDKFD